MIPPSVADLELLISYSKNPAGQPCGHAEGAAYYYSRGSWVYPYVLRCQCARPARC